MVLLVAASAVSLMFAATPFLIPAVADRYGVSVGTAGFISATQVSGFAAVTFIAGRWWKPTRTKLVAAALLASVFDVASALTGSFAVLLGLRLLAGGAAGVFTWLAWSDAMRDADSMRDVAAVGPITVLVGAPLLGWLVGVGGDQALYWLLAVSPLPVTILKTSFGTPEGRKAKARMSPSRSNLVLLVALGVLTMAGSALFVFVGALAEKEIGLGIVALSLGFSVNALAGLIGTRWRPRPGQAWPWMIAIAASAVSFVIWQHPVMFFVGMFGWGFAFWMAVPVVLGSVAEWSFAPDERVGDAQSIMAIGRAIGPAVGGLLVGSGAFVGLGWFAGLGLGFAALLVGFVERYRRDRVGPALA